MTEFFLLANHDHDVALDSLRAILSRAVEQIPSSLADNALLANQLPASAALASSHCSPATRAVISVGLQLATLSTPLPRRLADLEAEVRDLNSRLASSQLDIQAIQKTVEDEWRRIRAEADRAMQVISRIDH